MDPILSIAEASKLIAAKQLSPVELTKDCLARMKARWCVDIPSVVGGACSSRKV